MGGDILVCGLVLGMWIGSWYVNYQGMTNEVMSINRASYVVAGHAPGQAQ